MDRTDELLNYWSPQLLRKHSRLIAVTVLSAGLLGAVLGLLRSPTYTAEARLAVGSGAMSDLNIPGFPTASADMAANYARWVNAAGLSGAKLPDSVSSVTASPFPESNVIRIEAQAKRGQAAREAARTTAQLLLREVNRVSQANDTDELLSEVERRAAVAADAVVERDRAQTELQTLREVGAATSEVEAARQELLRITSRAARAELVLSGLQDRYRRLVSTQSTESQLSLIGDGAQVVGSDRWSVVQRFILLGAGLGVFLALLSIRLVERRQNADAAEDPETQHADGSKPVTRTPA